MKKKFAIALLLMIFAFASGVSPAVAETWQDMLSWMEQRETIRTEGAEFLAELRREAPSGTERELWKMLWVGEARSRAAAGVALMDRIFPAGSPARWEEARGFMAGSFYIPRQLAGMDALFVTVAALDAVPGGEWTAAAYLRDFARSGRGMVKFIEQIPSGLQKPINSIIEKTGLDGDWTVKTARRQLPLLPVYGGTITRDGAESRALQYVDGVGRLASNGYYAWDRDKGRIYKVVEGSDSLWVFD